MSLCPSLLYNSGSYKLNSQGCGCFTSVRVENTFAYLSWGLLWQLSVHTGCDNTHVWKLPCASLWVAYALPSGLGVSMHQALVLFGVSYVYFEVYDVRYRFRKVAEAQHVMCCELDVCVGLPCREIIYLMVSFKGVRHHSFSFSGKPHSMVTEPLFSIDCSSVDDLTVPCLFG